MIDSSEKADKAFLDSSDSVALNPQKSTLCPKPARPGLCRCVFSVLTFTGLSAVATFSYFWPATHSYHCAGAHVTPDSAFLFKYPGFILNLYPRRIISNSPVIVKIEMARLALEATEPEC